MSDVYEKIEQDNVKLRADYSSKQHCYTMSELQNLAHINGFGAQNSVSTWKADRRIFSVNENEVEYFPSFQFLNGKPKPIIQELLLKMPDDMSDWQIAFWFVSGNGYIENEDPPQESLDDKEDINAAVKALLEEIFW